MTCQFDSRVEKNPTQPAGIHWRVYCLTAEKTAGTRWPICDTLRVVKLMYDPFWMTEYCKCCGEFNKT